MHFARFTRGRRVQSLFRFSFQMSVEMFDYMDDILNLQRAGRYIPHGGEISPTFILLCRRNPTTGQCYSYDLGTRVSIEAGDKVSINQSDAINLIES